MKTEILKRTFEAVSHPKGSPERERLNRDCLTSEYMPSHRYMTRRPFLMSDGSQNPAQEYLTNSYRTKVEAERA